MEHRDQRLGVVKAEGSSRDHPELVVEAVDEAVGEPLLEVGDDAVESLADRPGDLHEGFERRAGGPGGPVADGARCVAGLPVVEGLGERLLEDVEM